MPPVLQDIANKWFLFEPAFFTILFSHRMVENNNMEVLFRVGQKRVEYNPKLLSVISDSNKVEDMLRYEMIRIMLGHPYMRQPENPIKSIVTMASNCVIRDNYPRAKHLYCPSVGRKGDGLCFEEYYKLINDDSEDSLGFTQGDDNTSKQDQEQIQQEQEQKQEPQDGQEQRQKEQEKQEQQEEQKRRQKEQEKQEQQEGQERRQKEQEKQEQQDGQEQRQKEQQKQEQQDGQEQQEEQQREQNSQDEADSDSNPQSGGDVDENPSDNSDDGSQQSSTTSKDDAEEGSASLNGSETTSQPNSKGDGINSSQKRVEALAQQSELWEDNPLTQSEMNEIITNIVNSKTWGSLPGNLIEVIKSSLVVKIDYRRILSMFRASVLSSQRHLTRMLPSRRYGFDFMGSKRDMKSSLLVAIDTSGSVSIPQVQLALAAINRTFKYGVESIDVVQFDARVYEGTLLNLHKAQHEMRIQGRGGTDFQPVIDYYCEAKKYDGLMIITDGYAQIPTLPRTFRGHILWMLYNESASRSDNRYTLPSELKWIDEFPRSRYLILPLSK